MPSTPNWPWSSTLVGQDSRFGTPGAIAGHDSMAQCRGTRGYFLGPVRQWKLVYLAGYHPVSGAFWLINC